MGIKEGCANLGEVCKVLFNEAKQAWEDLAAYEARMQAVRELEKKQELFRFAFDAENYYLGQDRMLGYMMAEMVQIVFGGEILKGAAKGVSKGVQFVKEGAKVVEEVKVVAEMGKVFKPLGLGSTGRNTAINLTEQLVMQEIMSNPGMGRVIKEAIKDSRWKGWSKMAWNNAGVEIHYVAKFESGVLKVVDDFKFIVKK